MNIDTDLQFAFTEGIRDYMNNNIKYLMSQIGNQMVVNYQIKFYDLENG